MNAEVDSLKDDLEAAMTQLDVQETASEPAMQPTADKPLASAGQEDALPSESAEAAPDTEQDNQQKAEDAAAPAERPVRGRKPLAAPVGWNPELKQAFSTLPEPVQRAIHAREVETAKVMEDTVAARKLAEGFVQTVQPYEALMKAEGAQSPMQAVQQLLNTAATLALGSPVAKAQRIAGLIKHYGVDIDTLDKTLAGQMPENPEEDRLQRMLDQKLQPYQQFMQQVDQMRQTQAQQVVQFAEQSVEEFGADPRNEYYDVVRGKMADFLDVAVQNKQPITLEEAYQRACMATPEVVADIQQRYGQGQNSQQHMQSKNNAASSISGRRGSGPSGNVDYSKMGLREMLEAQLPGQQRI